MAIFSQIGIWLENSARPFCQGVLISKNYVLTAAHSININDFYHKSPSRVSIGDTKYNIPLDGEKYIKVTSIHPNYNPKTGENDIALIRLPSPISALTSK